MRGEHSGRERRAFVAGHPGGSIAKLPLKRALDAFMDEASRLVTGDIRLRLHGGRAVVTGRRSPTSLYNYELATYDTGDTFDQALAKGFVELWGLPSKIAAMRDSQAGG